MRLSPDQLKQYHDDGFLIVRDVFDRQELAPLKEEINQQVDELAQGLFQAGKITNLHEDKDFYHRLTALERDYPGAAVLIHIGGVLKPQLAALWSSPKLLDMIEQLLGSEIVGHPVWNLRSKTPTNSLATVPWHQDTAYLAAGCEHTFQPTAWIPLLDADAENGTLQVIRGAHRLGRVLPHQLENKKGNKASWYLYIDQGRFAAWRSRNLQHADGLGIASQPVSCPIAARRITPAASAGAWTCAGSAPGKDMAWKGSRTRSSCARLPIPITRSIGLDGRSARRVQKTEG